MHNVVKSSDILVFVSDARMPELSRNRRLEELIARFNKHCVSVFTKIDLVSEEQLARLKEQYPATIFVSGTRNIGLKQLKIKILIIGKRFGNPRPKIGIVGYPNVGKSAIINALAHRRRTAVSPKAGTTRGVQFVKAGSLKILDTPGVIPAEDSEHKLALLAAKNPEKLKNPENIALDILNMMLQNNKPALKAIYGIQPESEDAYELLLQIGNHRGFLKRGGAVDEVKTALTIIRNWQRGKLRL